jgi:hypothetical protein
MTIGVEGMILTPAPRAPLGSLLDDLQHRRMIGLPAAVVGDGGDVRLRVGTVADLPGSFTDLDGVRGGHGGLLGAMCQAVVVGPDHSTMIS